MYFNFKFFSILSVCVYIQLIIPKRSKKAVDTGRKKTTLVKAKNSTTATKSTDLNLHGSFLTPSGGTIVRSVSSSQPPPSSDPVIGNDRVLAYLHKIDANNQALLKRLDDLESQCVNPTTVQATNSTVGKGPLTKPK